MNVHIWNAHLCSDIKGYKKHILTTVNNQIPRDHKRKLLQTLDGGLKWVNISLLKYLSLPKQ